MELLERGDETAALSDLLARAAAGTGRLGLVEGPAEIGKTRVLAGLDRDRAKVAADRMQRAEPLARARSPAFAEQALDASAA